MELHTVKMIVNDDSVDMDLSDEKEMELVIPPTAGNGDSAIYDQLKDFLSSIAMNEYVHTFIKAGFISMNDFQNITFNDLVHHSAHSLSLSLSLCLSVSSQDVTPVSGYCHTVLVYL